MPEELRLETDVPVEKRQERTALLAKARERAKDPKTLSDKDRLTRIEGKGEGQVGQTQSSTASTHLIIAGLALLVSVTMVLPRPTSSHNIVCAFEHWKLMAFFWYSWRLSGVNIYS